MRAADPGAALSALFGNCDAASAARHPRAVTADDLPAAFESPAGALAPGAAGLDGGIAERGRQPGRAGVRHPAHRAGRPVPRAALRAAAEHPGRDPGAGPVPQAGACRRPGVFGRPHGKPHSLQRVFKVLEWSTDPASCPRPAGCWTTWARRGVLLLNPALTVEIGSVGSHTNCGLACAHMPRCVKLLCELPNAPTFLLWGRLPRTRSSTRVVSDGTSPTVLRTRHPSHDFKREFMAAGSHFVATQAQIGWWAFGQKAA